MDEERIDEEEKIREGDEDTLPYVDPDAVGHEQIAKAARRRLLTLIEQDSLEPDELTQFRALAALVTEETKLEVARVTAESRKSGGVDPDRVRRVRGHLGENRGRMTRAATGTE